MSRVPIRLRLTLAFALAMAVVLAAMGAFLYFRLGSSLDETIDENLQARAAELAPVVANNPSALAGGAAGDETFATVVSADDPFVTPDERVRAAQGQVTVERDEVAGVEGPVRLLLTPLPDGSILAVGASLEARRSPRRPAR